MTTVNILEKWQEGILANSPGYSTDDASQAFRDAWSKGDTALFLPQVPDGPIGSNHILSGFYPVADLDPPDGCVIRCESDAVEVRGIDRYQSIFSTSAEKWRIRIVGGTWARAASVWTHRGISYPNKPLPILKLCRFEGMRIRDVDVGFRFDGAFRTLWRDLEVRGVITGIELNIDQYYLNDNHIDGCVFHDCNNGSVVLYGEERKYHFTISRCLFQNPGSPSNRAAIFISDNARSITIQECFFEAVGTTDIELVSQTRPLRSIMIRGCRFSTGSPGQAWRIRNVGRASYVAEDNMVRLGEQQTFARCEGAATDDIDFKVWLFRNCIHFTGSGSPDYDLLLFDDSQGQQSVEFTRNEASQRVSFP